MECLSELLLHSVSAMAWNACPKPSLYLLVPTHSPEPLPLLLKGVAGCSRREWPVEWAAFEGGQSG